MSDTAGGLTVVGLQVLALGVSTIIGVGLLAATGPRAARLIVVAPIVGIAFVVCFLHWQTLVTGVGVAPWLAPLAIAGSALIAVRHRRVSWGHVRCGLLRALPAWGAGILAAAVASTPSFVAGTNRLAMPSGSHDAFYYVELSRWLMRSPGTVEPDILGSPATSADSPVFGPALATLETPLRFGQELFQGWMSAVTGIDLVDSFTPWIAFYVGVAAIAASFLLESFGIRYGWAAVGGLFTGLSSTMLTQTLMQNADSLLGIGLAMALLGTAVRAFRWPSSSGRAAPLVLPGLLLSAVVGTYVEIVIFVAPALLTIALFSRVERLASKLARGLVIVLLAVLIAPFAWIRGLRSLLFLQDYSGDDPTRLSLATIIRSVLGSLSNLALGMQETGVSGWLGTAVVAALACVAIIGTGCAFIWRPTRATSLGLIGGGTAIVVVLATRGNEYTFQRAIDLLTPLAVGVVLAGFWGASRHLTSRIRVPQFFPATVMVTAGTLWVGASLLSFGLDVRKNWEYRVVGDEFAQVKAWAQATDVRRNGAGLIAYVPNFFDQLWVVDALADLPDVEYPTLRGDLGYLYVEDFDDGAAAPEAGFALIGPGADFDAPSDAVVDRNSRFALLDLGDETGFAVAFPHPPVAAWGFDIGTSPTREDILGASGAVLGLDVGAEVDKVRIDLVTVGEVGAGGLPFSPQTLTAGWSVVSVDGTSVTVARTRSATTDGIIDFAGWPQLGTFYVADVSVE